MTLRSVANLSNSFTIIINFSNGLVHFCVAVDTFLMHLSNSVSWRSSFISLKTIKHILKGINIVIRGREKVTPIFTNIIWRRWRLCVRQVNEKVECARFREGVKGVFDDPRERPGKHGNHGRTHRQGERPGEK